MNKYLRAFFLPIMIIAGIFTSFMCVVIIAPVVIYHWLQERKLIPLDIQKDEEYLQRFHSDLKHTTITAMKNEPSDTPVIH